MGEKVMTVLFEVPRWIRLLGLVLYAMVFFTPWNAPAQSNPVNLERLVRDAGVIFSGTVIRVETGEKDPGMNLFTTYYTFAVENALYGVETDTMTIKQYGGEAGGRSYYPPGVPRFEVGETVVAFFYPPSKIGMTSAVSKGQGKFVVGPADSTGLRLVENETHNRNLFRRIRNGDLIVRPEWLEGDSESPVDYVSFVATVRNLVGILKK
jgi:hypothetical protein